MPEQLIQPGKKGCVDTTVGDRPACTDYRATIRRVITQIHIGEPVMPVVTKLLPCNHPDSDDAPSPERIHCVRERPPICSKSSQIARI